MTQRQGKLGVQSVPRLWTSVSSVLLLVTIGCKAPQVCCNHAYVSNEILCRTSVGVEKVPPCSEVLPEGVILEDLRAIQAIEVFGDQAAMRDMEASENLHRRPLAPIERAMFVHALCEAARDRFASEHGDLSNQQAAIKLRWARVRAGEMRAEQAIQDESDDTADKMSAVYGWQESAADALGLDVRTIRRSLEIYRLLVEPFPDLIRALADHPVVGENGAQLKQIAAVKDEAQRRAVIEALLGNSELSADEARVAVGIDSPKGAAEQPVHQKYVNAVTGNLARLTASLQKRHLPSFVTALKSDEVKRALRDLLNEELGHAR